MGRNAFRGMAAVVAVLVALSAAAFAAQSSRTQSPAVRSGSRYDPGTVETVRGQVVKIERTGASRRGASRGVRIVVKTAAGEILVGLGPSGYLDAQPVRIEAKDDVVVTGSHITYQGKPAIIASEVRKGDAVLKLRDANGTPVWYRRKPR
jgi:hypothetical protein